MAARSCWAARGAGAGEVALRSASAASAAETAAGRLGRRTGMPAASAAAKAFAGGVKASSVTTKGSVKSWPPRKFGDGSVKMVDGSEGAILDTRWPLAVR